MGNDYCHTWLGDADIANDHDADYRKWEMATAALGWECGSGA